VVNSYSSGTRFAATEVAKINGKHNGWGQDQLHLFKKFYAEKTSACLPVTRNIQRWIIS